MWVCLLVTFSQLNYSTWLKLCTHVAFYPETMRASSKTNLMMNISVDLLIKNTIRQPILQECLKRPKLSSVHHSKEKN